MRILLLNQFYRPDVAATGQLLADVGEALAARGHEVHVICSRRRYGGGSLTPAADEVLDGVHVHRVLTTGFGRKRLAGERRTICHSTSARRGGRCRWAGAMCACR
jgi:hypothetical protein